MSWLRVIGGSMSGKRRRPVVCCDGNTVVALCDRSGISLRPWREVGFRCVLVDVSFRPGLSYHDGMTRVGCDVRTLSMVRGRPLGVFCFPPCDHLAGVGAGSWKRKGSAALLDGLSVADACVRWAVRSRASWWLVENPSGRLSVIWGPPDHVFSPHHFGGWLAGGGDRYTKRTCLWTGGAFVMPERREVRPVEGSLVGAVGDRVRRSETPRGFARACFETLRPRGSFRARCAFRSIDPLRTCDSLQPGKELRPPARRPCRCCGREFQERRADQLFCGPRCRLRAWRDAGGVARDL